MSMRDASFWSRIAFGSADNCTELLVGYMLHLYSKYSTDRSLVPQKGRSARCPAFWGISFIFCREDEGVK
jgi:hypothetical protein